MNEQQHEANEPQHEANEPQHETVETGRADLTERDDTEGEEGTLDEPVMDGATEKFDPETNPRKGMDDPALIRDIDSGKKTINPYG